MISAAASAIISRRAATRLRKILAARWMRPSKRARAHRDAPQRAAAPGEAQDVETARPQQYSNDGSHLRPQLFACASRDDAWAFGAKGSKGESTP